MKTTRIIIILFITLLIGCNEGQHEITITGKIKGEIPEKIEYSVPINGGSNLEFRASVVPDSLGVYQIKIPLEKASFIQLFVFKKALMTLIAEPNMKYEVNFDLTNKDQKQNFEILSENKEAQYLFNTLPNPGFIQSGIGEFLKDSVASQIIFNIKTKKEKELLKFQDFLANQSISKEFYNLVDLDRTYYYMAVQGTIGFAKYLMNQRKEGTFTDDIKNMWQQTFENDLLTREDFQRTKWGYALAENYLIYKGYQVAAFDNSRYLDSVKDKVRAIHELEEAEKHLSSNILEYYKACYIYQNCFQKNYEKEFIGLFDQFTEAYPSSAYTAYIEPQVAPIVAFHKKAEQPLNKKTEFIEDRETKNTLNDVLTQFKGKKVFIDVWATWCGPCKKEFAHKEALKNMLDNKGIALVYISIDKEKRDAQWKDMIKFYDLEGHHLRVNETLLTELRELYNNNGSISVPWYILVDEQGKIIKKHAKKPSQLKALEEEIESFV